MSASGRMRLEACLLVLALWSCGARAESLGVCYGYGCHKQASFEVLPADMQGLARLFAGVKGADDERQAIARAIGLIERIGARTTPIGGDRGGNFADGAAEGRRDCVDHSTSTSEWLVWLNRHGWMRFHQPMGRTWRAPRIVDLHYTAWMRDDQGQDWAVDSWFFDNGHDVVVVPLPVWNEGYSPS